MKKRGLTLIEALVVLVIVAILTGILIPVMGKVKRNAQINESLSRLQQLWSAMEIYRNEWDGSNVDYSSLAALGLPKRIEGWLGFNENFFRSPCGFDMTHWTTSGVSMGVAGYYIYVPPTYDPANDHLPHRYRGYLKKYRENAPLFIDIYCNPAGMDLHEKETLKRGLAVLISGQLVNKYSTGYMNLYFFSDPPE